MKNVYLYCSNIKTQKKVKEAIERETGIEIKRCMSNIRNIKDSYGLGIFVDDNELNSDYKFNDEDVVIVLDEIDFMKWLKYKKDGVRVFKYSDSFYSLLNHFLKCGVKTEKQGGEDLKEELEFMAERISDIFKGDKEIITFYSIKDGVGKSSIIYEWGKILSGKGKNVAILDLDRQYSYMRFLQKEKGELEELDTSKTGLGFNVYRHTETNLHVIDLNLNIDSDLSGVYITNILYKIRNHFDIILVDTDSFYGEGKEQLFKISNRLQIVVDDREDILLGTVDFIEKHLDKCIEYGVIENKGGVGGEILRGSFKIPFGVDKIKGVLEKELQEGSKEKPRKFKMALF